MKEGVDVRDATHVKVDGQWEHISLKWGVSPDGRLAKPSEGGFGVTTDNGKNISMWDAESYGQEEK